MSPSQKDMQETGCSLQFAQRVCATELGTAKRGFESGQLVKLREVADKADQEVI